MAAPTIYRLSEEIKNLLDGGLPAVASSISFNEIKIAIGQVANSLLKTEHFNINEQLGESIPNGTVLGLYEGLVVSKYGNTSKCTLPIKPIKLRRNIGIFSIFDSNGNEFIPMQMGQAFLAKSQRLINDLSGQTGYENFGLEIIFNKDITNYPNIVTVSARLAIMDISQYSDYEPLPILPEMEWQIKQQVFAMYSQQPIPDKLIDSTVSEDMGPIKQQAQN
jgi:hypothetical protein